MANILVVDDRPINRKLLVSLLGYQEHCLLEASDGAEALSLVRSHHPDLVITDIVMPTMDGYEFVHQLRADPAISTTPVIFYTANYHKHEAESLASDCGVDHILTKPCESEHILRVVNESLHPHLITRPSLSHDFNQEHLRVITNKLSQTVDGLRISNQRLAALIDVNLQFASERDPQQLLTNVCSAARDLLGAKYALLAVETRNNKNDIYFITSGMDAEMVENLGELTLSEGVVGSAFTECKPHRLTNPQGDPQALGLPLRYPPVHSLLVGPIVSLTHVYGWICLTDKIGAEAFNAEDERLLGILAAQVGRIYENGNLYIEIRQQAIQREAEIEQRKLVQEALTDSEERFRQMAENIRDVFFLVDANSNRMLYISPAYEEIWGRSCASLYANPDSWNEAIHQDDKAATCEKYKQQGMSAGKFEYEYRILRPDESIRWLEVRGFPIRDVAGQMIRIAGVAKDITESREAARELRESERRFSNMLDNVELISVMLDREGQITYCNDYLLRLTGWRREEVIGGDWFELFMPPELGDMKPAFIALLANLPETWHRENDIFTRSGERRLIRWNNSVLRSGAGSVIGSASIGEDITAQKQAEINIRRLNRVYTVLSSINALIMRVHDRDELFREACRIAVEQGQYHMAWIGIVDWNAMKIVPIASAGTEPEFLTLIRDRYSLREDTPLEPTMTARAVKEKKAIVSNEIRDDPTILFAKEYIAHSISSKAILPLLVSNEVVGIFVLYADKTGFFDESEIKLLTELASDIAFAIDHIDKQERLNYLAYYDALTGLANRSLFLERVAQYIRSAIDGGHKLALYLIDLDRFKNINDSLGQPAGDELLRQVAEWLRHTVGDASLLARVSADHFAAVMPTVKQEGSIVSLLEKMLDAFMEHPFQLNDAIFRISAKVGIALFPADGASVDALFKNAEAALKKAKASGDRYLFYTQTMTATVAVTLTLENQLRQAIDKEEFVLHYQPKVNIASEKLTGAEALIRWNDPRTGQLVPPDRFIPILEETGLIYDVGRWALRKAVEDYLRWRNAGLAAVRIAVNVSPLQLRNRSFITEIEQAIGIDKHAAAGLELEITESIIMADVKNSIFTLNSIRNMGVTIAIDDFGTGFSSLSYLAKLPVDTLKIDRSFVIDMTAEPEGLALVSTIINLAHSLKLKVVAEGVETEGQLRLLRLLSCDEMQGYLFSKPVPINIFETRYLVPPPGE